MTLPTLPSWWPPSGYEELTEAQVRELFAYLKTVVPPVTHVGDDLIQVWPTTTKQLAGRRLGYFGAIEIVHLAARTHDETVSIAIGLRADGALTTLEGTAEQS